MMARIWHVALNTFREAVRDRVLYNLVFFALLLVATAPLFGQISIGLERIVLVNLGLTAISIFGVVIAIFIGTGLVSKEIEKRTLYTVLARPVRRWEFILGKYFGLSVTLGVNTLFMVIGFFLALLYVTKGVQGASGILAAVYLIMLQFLILIAITLLFSSFSSPLFAAVFAFSIYAIGCFAEDLRGFAEIVEGVGGRLAVWLSYVVPNFGSMNIISPVSHQKPVSGRLLLTSTLYALAYASAALSAAILIFERRDMK